MFCFSLKSVKHRVLMSAFAIVVLCCVVLALNNNVRVAPVNATAFPSGKTHSERIDFLSRYGWVVQDDPIGVEDVLIPSVFGDVYSNYNAIQQAQGFDLLPYAGRSVKKWVYAITNYPGYADSEAFVQATLLVCQGVIIGGDICSVELDGFMHGFAYESSF